MVLIYKYGPHLRQIFIFFNPREVVFRGFARGTTTCHGLTNLCLPLMRPIIILLLFSTVATHILYKTIHFLGKKANNITRISSYFLIPYRLISLTTKKKHYQSAMTYTFILEQQANTLTLVFYSLNISICFCSYHIFLFCVLMFYIFVLCFDVLHFCFVF